MRRFLSFFKKKKRVYCRNCKYLRWEHHPSTTHHNAWTAYECISSNNKFTYRCEDWKEFSIRTYLKYPGTINDKGDCKWFQKKN